MKKYLFPLIAIIFISSIGVWYYTDAEKNTNNMPYVQPYYIALGDSLAAGMGVPTHMGYTDDYFNYLLKKDVKTKYLNLGHGGDTTDDLLSIVNVNQSELKKATTITINIGINDIFERLKTMEAQVPPEEIKNTYDSIANNIDIILKKLKEISPQAKVVVLNYYNPFPDDQWFATHIEYLNKIIKIKTEKYAFVYVDTHSAFAGSGLKYLMKDNYQSDPIHPNIEGYKAMADQISKKNP